MTREEPLPGAIGQRVLQDGVAYDLPRRPLGRARIVGYVLVPFGLVFAGGPLVGTLSSALGSTGGGWGQWIFLLFCVPFVLAGLGIAGAGLAMLLGRSSIELRRDRIVAVEHVGPLRWRRSRDGSKLQAIDVKRGSTRQGRQPLSDLAAMTAEFTTEKRLHLATGYPVAWLGPLSRRVAGHLERERPADLTAEQGEGIRVTESEVAAERPRSEWDLAGVARPRGSRVTLAENPDGVTLVIPPAGVRKGSKGLFVFSLLWCGFMTVFSTASVVIPLASGKAAAVWPFAAFSVLFWAIGIWMLVAAINMGRRHAIIDVVEDVLLVNRKNLFGLKSHQWTRGEIDRVGVGPSGMSVNDVPVPELKIRLRDETEIGLFAGRDPPELRWMASVIREALGPPGQ